MSKNQFRALKVLREIGIRLVPERPTRDMCEAGMAAGGSEIDADTVRRIYSAMLIVAADCALHGDNTLN